MKAKNRKQWHTVRWPLFHMSRDWSALLYKSCDLFSGWSLSFVQQRSRTDMENNTSAPACEQPHDADMGVMVGRTVGLSLASGVALVGSLLVLIVFKRNPSTRTNVNVFIVNMAASDLLLPLFRLPMDFVYIFLGPGRFLIEGPVGEFLCKLVPFVADISLSVSIQSLVLIAVDRFVAVVYPLRAVTFSPRRRTRLVIGTWIVAAVLHSPYWVFFRLKTACNRFYCVIDWTPPFDTYSASVTYSGVLANLLVAFPLLVIACLYAAILIKLKRTNVPGDRSSQTDPQGSRRRERNKNITKMSVCIVVAFALCYLPFYFLMMRPFIRTSPSTNFFFIAFNLVYANGAVNPWILFYFCGNFRRGLRDMFGCNDCCCQISDYEVDGRNIELQIVDGNAPENWISVLSCESNCYGTRNKGVWGHYVLSLHLVILIPVWNIAAAILSISFIFFHLANNL